MAGSKNMNEDDGELDIAHLISVILGGKWWIVASTILFAIAGLVYVTIATPVFSGNVLIQVENKSAGLPGLSEMADIFTQDSSSSAEIEILKSRNVLGLTVDKLNLRIEVQPKFFPVIGSFFYRRHRGKDGLASPLFGMFNTYAWGGEIIRVTSLRLPRYLLGKKLTLRAGRNGRYKLFHEDRVLLEGVALSRKGSGKASQPAARSTTAADNLAITVTDLVARPGTLFTVTLHSRLNRILDLQKVLRIREKGKKTGVLELKLEHPDKLYIISVLDDISANYQAQNVERISQEAGRSLSFIKKRLPKLKDELQTAEAKLNSYKLKRNSADITLETKGLLDRLVEIDAKISELQLKEVEIGRRFTRTHPTYVALIEQRDKLQKLRGSLSGRIRKLPETQQEILGLVKEVKLKQESYLQMLNKSQELGVIKAGTVGNVRILDRAVALPRPVKPRKAAIVFGLTLAGMALGLGGVFLRSVLYRFVDSVSDLEDLDLAVFATLPESELQKKNATQKYRQKAANGTSIAAYLYPEDVVVEAIRGLRTSLHFAMLEAKNNVLMISGPLPNVGKSFVSSNLAALLAEGGSKIILIDADIRRGDLSEVLHKAKQPGLSNLIAGDANTSEAIVNVSKNFDYIPRGTISPNPSELLMQPYVEQLFEYLSKVYEYVIIDSPPILPVTDASILGKYAGSVLFVVHYGTIHISEVQAALKRFETAGIKINGAILNGVTKRAGSSYKDYGYYKTYKY